MQTIQSSESEAQDAPRSGAPAPAPFLDKGGRNVPGGSARPSWIKKQWVIRRGVLDRLRFWHADGYQCLWVTLTSSPKSALNKLRADFQALRKRIGRELGFGRIEYVCVDTREGHGVLHMIWAWRDADSHRKASFYIPFDWLQSAWNDLHGAFHVNVKRIGGADRDARRLSRYIVAQYCGGQNALVRFSQSRLPIPLSRMRAELLRLIRNLPERYALGNKLVGVLSGEELDRVFNQTLWLTFREAWDSLVRSRSCEAYGVKIVWWAGALQRV